MSRERLQLALELLKPEQWRIFEEFASNFLVTTYPNLRTIALSSGDKGRDSELFSLNGKNEIVLQYSTTKDWRRKILKTAKTIENNFPDVKLLIYVTNQPILSAADRLKSDLISKYSVVLDIHDRSWFLDRIYADENHIATAETLAEKVVDPVLSNKKIIRHSAPTLTSFEYQAALTFLQLQLEDDIRAKGLTRVSFEALIRTILRDTHSESKVTRSEIHDRIIKLLPGQETRRVIGFTDSALNKLNKRYIRHWPKSDEFCLTFEESKRVAERLATLEVANNRLDNIVATELREYKFAAENIDIFCNITRSVIDNFFLERGEVFAAAVSNDKMDRLGVEELETAVTKTIDSAIPGWDGVRKGKVKAIVLDVTMKLLADPHDDLTTHLRSKADAYTIFAFLGQTPDVQSAASKMFSHGTIWLDTTIVLPLFAETLLENGHKRFTQMLNAASEAHLRLKITPGVIEEVERHMNRCRTYVRVCRDGWTGNVPFLANAYLRSGRSLDSLTNWLENFIGQERPEDDLSEYLDEFFQIERESLEEHEIKASDAIKNIVFETWRKAHDRRRSNDHDEMDELSISRLVRHDVENYLGVIEFRKREKLSPLGFSAWWLTLDRVAVRVDEALKAELQRDAPPTPLISADFLVNCLAFGPVRSRISKESSSLLPLLIESNLFTDTPSDLLLEAERIRLESSNLPENVIRRRVRDHLDTFKRRRGEITDEGVQYVLEEIDRNGLIS